MFLTVSQNTNELFSILTVVFCFKKSILSSYFWPHFSLLSVFGPDWSSSSAATAPQGQYYYPVGVSLTALGVGADLTLGHPHPSTSLSEALWRVLSSRKPAGPIDNSMRRPASSFLLTAFHGFSLCTTNHQINPHLPPNTPETHFVSFFTWASPPCLNTFKLKAPLIIVKYKQIWTKNSMWLSETYVFVTNSHIFTVYVS